MILIYEITITESPLLTKHHPHASVVSFLLRSAARHQFAPQLQNHWHGLAALATLDVKSARFHLGAVVTKNPNSLGIVESD